MRKKAARPQRIVEEKDDEDEAENEQPNALLAPIASAEARFTTHAPISICIRAPDDKFHIFSELGVLQENVSQSVTVAWEHSVKHIVISQPDQLHGDGASTSYAIPSASSSSRVLAKVRPPDIEAGNLLFSLLASGHLGLTTHRNHSTSLCLAIHSCMFEPRVFKSSDDDIEDYTDVDLPSPHAHLLAILSWLHPESSEATTRGFASVEELFSMLCPPSGPTNQGVSFIQPPRLLPSLRPYQVAAVQWMMKKEKQEVKASVLHPSWHETKSIDPSQPPLFVNVFNGRLSSEVVHQRIKMGRGGILSEEMGLGKTCEVLALILSSLSDEGSSKKEKATWRPNIKCVDLCHVEEDDDYEEEEEEHEEDGGTSKSRRKRKTNQKSLGRKRPRQSPQCTVCGNNNIMPYDPAAIRRRFSDLRRERRPFICGGCLRAHSEATSDGPNNSTLVVCPASILPQWQSEIIRHAPSVSLLVYPGQDLKDGSYHQVFNAHDFSRYEIVLTSYETMRKDLTRQPDAEDPNTSRSLRGKVKRYEILVTPLTRLCWKRVCLDEAQMIEGGSAGAFKMAMKLKSERRWCISGTPVSSGLDDLKGLLSFLQVKPSSAGDTESSSWFIRFTSTHGHKLTGRSRDSLMRPLVDLLSPNSTSGGLLWRNTKKDVADQLGIPPQHSVEKIVHLSKVERFFYNSNFNECSSAIHAFLPPSLLRASLLSDQATVTDPVSTSAERAPSEQEEVIEIDAAASRVDRDLSVMERKRLEPILLKLRLACCHPQLGASGVRRIGGRRGRVAADPSLGPTGHLLGGGAGGGGGGGEPMSMTQVLETLLEKQRIAVIDTQRALLSTMNGLAGLLCLQGKGEEALDCYKESRRVIETNLREHKVKTDKSLRLHISSNMALVLSQLKHNKQEGGDEEERAVTVERLMEEAEAIKTEMSKSLHQMMASSLFDFRKGLEESDYSTIPSGTHQMSHTSPTLPPNKGPTPPAPSPYPYPHQMSHTSTEWLDQVAQVLSMCGQTKKCENRVRSNLVFGFDQHQRPMMVKKLDDSRSSLPSIFPLMRKEVNEMDAAASKALTSLDKLIKTCEAPSSKDVEVASTCGRCRAELGIDGRVCRHCILDEEMKGWERTLYRCIESSSEGPAGGVWMNPEEDDSNVRRLLTETEVAMNTMVRLLKREMEKEGSPISDSFQFEFTSRDGSRHSVSIRDVVDAGESHLLQLSARRKLHALAVDLSTRQRSLLYVFDEIKMALMRVQCLTPGEVYSLLSPHEKIFKIHADEIQVRIEAMEDERVIHEGELSRALGSLRYLENLQRDALDQAASRAANQMWGENDTLPSSSSSSSAVADAAPRQCPICHDAVKGRAAVLSPCAHILCWECCEVLVARRGTRADHLSIQCPSCRSGVLLRDISYVTISNDKSSGQVTDDDVINKTPARPLQGESEGVNATEVAAEGGAGGFSELEALDAFSRDSRIQIKGSYSSKIEAIVKRILFITRSSLEDKIIVFSSWPWLLDVIAHALKSNGVSYAYGKGQGKELQRALFKFRGEMEGRDLKGRDLEEASDDDVSEDEEDSDLEALATAPIAPPAARDASCSVLLLSIKQGGKGLTLNEANHVILAEPGLDPAAEKQAIGRVDRIGQKRETYVHRFVASRTVEEQVISLARSKWEGGKSTGLKISDITKLMKRDGEIV